MSDWVIGIGVVVVPGVVAFVVNIVRERRRLRVFYDREDLRGEWRERFPESSEAEVGEFLRMFVDAFLLRRGAEFAFGPGDRVMDVYRGIYPRRGMADAMEGEVFVISVTGEMDAALREQFDDVDVTVERGVSRVRVVGPVAEGEAVALAFVQCDFRIRLAVDGEGIEFVGAAGNLLEDHVDVLSGRG